MMQSTGQDLKPVHPESKVGGTSIRSPN